MSLRSRFDALSRIDALWVKANLSISAAATRWLRLPTPRGRARASASPELAERAAWNRFQAASECLVERRAAFLSTPNDLTAEQVRWAETELEDAVAVAGEFQVLDLRWSLG